MNTRPGLHSRKTTIMLAAAAVVAMSATAAHADVKLGGSWPDIDKTVSVEASSATRAQVLHKLARQMGWSLALQDLGGGDMSITAHDQPVGKLMQQVLSDRQYVANRDGDLVSIAKAPEAPVPAKAARASVETKTASASMSGGGDDDRVVFGGHVRVEPDETVDDVTVFGGSADVLGHVSGDVTVLGGRASVHKGGRVDGDATVLGGKLVLDDGSRVGGDVDALGGTLQRAGGASVGGSVTSGGGQRAAMSDLSLTGAASDVLSWPERLWNGLGGALARAALLFLLGAMFLALGPQRMEVLEVEIAKQPMRSLALGVVTALGVLAASVVLSITVVGIPVAVTLLMLGSFLALLASSAVLIVAGQALLRHRTTNRYVHLAVAGTVLTVVGLIPYIGTMAWAVVMSIGIGSLVATRGAGMFQPRRLNGAPQGPYRTNGA